MTRVLFAMQAPTLLNILATSRVWDLSVLDLGDSAGLAEVALSQVKPHGGQKVSHVFVCSPAQHEVATWLFPSSRIWWVLHTGAPTLVAPSGKHDVLVFSNRVKEIHQAQNPQLRIRVVTPAYQAQREWKWVPNVAWSMRSRPTTRHPQGIHLLKTVGEAVGAAFKCYGQGWPAGFLNAEQVLQLRRSCSAYVSALPTWAGFGLAEHECFAAGVPVVSSRWGGHARRDAN